MIGGLHESVGMQLSCNSSVSISHIRMNNKLNYAYLDDSSVSYLAFRKRTTNLSIQHIWTFFCLQILAKFVWALTDRHIKGSSGSLGAH